MLAGYMGRVPVSDTQAASTVDTIVLLVVLFAAVGALICLAIYFGRGRDWNDRPKWWETDWDWTPYEPPGGQGITPQEDKVEPKVEAIAGRRA
jgi:hypothetical protein